jgi:hypothetical protein
MKSVIRGDGYSSGAHGNMCLFFWLIPSQGRFRNIPTDRSFERRHDYN